MPSMVALAVHKENATSSFKMAPKINLIQWTNLSYCALLSKLIVLQHFAIIALFIILNQFSLASVFTPNR